MSIYEMELEMLSKKQASETQSMVESGQEFVDSELEEEDMGSELDRLINMQEVSLEDATRELES